MSKRISIANDFSKNPGGTYTTEGVEKTDSPERFLHEHLLPALLLHDKVVVNLNGTLGFGCSFIEGVFGKIAQDYPYWLSKIVLESDNEILESYIHKVVADTTEREKLNRVCTFTVNNPLTTIGGGDTISHEQSNRELGGISRWFSWARIQARRLLRMRGTHQAGAGC